MALPLLASLPQNGSIVSRWYLNEASGSRADSVGPNTLTAHNAPVSTTGQFGENAIDFNGSNQALTAADSASLSITGDLTFSSWVRMDTTGPNDNYFFAKYEAGLESYFFRANSGGTQFGEVIFPGSGNHNIAWSTGTWYFVTWVYTAAAGSVGFYRDGAFVTTITGFPVSISNTTSAVWMGALYSGTAYMNGQMQDAILWNTPLSAGEVTSLYSAYATPVASARLFLLRS